MTRLTLERAPTPFPMSVASTRSVSAQRAERAVAADAAVEARAPVCPIAPDVVDMDSELGYWRGHYRGLPGGSALRYGDYEPAVKLGLDAYMRAHGRRLDDMESELEACYRRTRGLSRLDWEQARAIVRLAWNHLHLRGLKE